MATGKRRARRTVSVAGTIMYIRHATAWDLDTIRNERLARNEDVPNLDPERVIVAEEEDRIIGFGIVERTNGAGGLRVKVFTRKGRKSVGSSIVSHVLETSGLVPEEHRHGNAPKMIVSRKKGDPSEADHGKGRRH